MWDWLHVLTTPHDDLILVLAFPPTQHVKAGTLALVSAMGTICDEFRLKRISNPAAPYFSTNPETPWTQAMHLRLDGLFEHMRAMLAASEASPGPGNFDTMTTRNGNIRIYVSEAMLSSAPPPVRLPGTLAPFFSFFLSQIFLC